ncbi:acyltransferase [Mucilaginibacter daejeonensis]|uniref:acyltransferase n=1 Tax=Mucilaginibacter daejeonensis TaxID=398049 RepID=UPI001D176461|nr:DapH/DapD/GlmU-related protein [Mucilaginibacter daejeonensis]UEG52171.1 acyltransferase [Mucilaginibacter daejeonensis]
MSLTQVLKKLRNEFLRKVKYRHYQIGKNFHSGIRVRIWGKQKIVIGENFYIGRDSFIESDAVIGDNVIMANRTAIVGRYDHHYQQIGMPIRLASQIRDHDYNWHGLNSLTVIEDDVWIGYGSVIMSGVTIKTGSIIAAGSVVTKDVESYSIYAGVPAKKVKDRFNSQQELQQHLTALKKSSKY